METKQTIDKIRSQAIEMKNVYERQIVDLKQQIKDIKGTQMY